MAASRHCPATWCADFDLPCPLGKFMAITTQNFYAHSQQK
jgi:hypothetical protein